MGVYMFGGIAKTRSSETEADEGDESLNNSIQSLGKATPGSKDTQSSSKLAYIEGSNRALKYSNELWLIRPDYAENSKRLKQSKNAVTQIKDKDFDYKNKKKAPSLSIEAVKLNPAGKPPAPRCLHSATAFGMQYVAFFGGKNDNFHKDLANVALNDICLYDISKLPTHPMIIRRLNLV